MSDFLEKEIFGKKKMADLFEEIYDNSKKKSKQISALITELKILIESTQDASIIVPLIVQYLDVSVKNDDHLIKIAAILQRAMQKNEGSSSDFNLSEKEIAQIQAEIKSFENKR
jgi:hypothetical protein